MGIRDRCFAGTYTDVFRSRGESRLGQQRGLPAADSRLLLRLCEASCCRTAQSNRFPDAMSRNFMRVYSQP